MRVLHRYPPNYHEILAVLPQASRRGVIFTYGDVIYAPTMSGITPALKAHEKVHSDRQKEVGGPDVWWHRYLTEPQFRFDEELMAHRAEYSWYRTYRPNKCREVIEIIAERLSSELYGTVVDWHRAKELVIAQVR